MNLVYCFFSYALDHACLAQAIRSIRLTDPRSKIAVFDDGAHPLPRLPASDFYERTHFNRRGNLNGRECIMGELLCFAKAARLTGANHVAKMDCDTVMVRPHEALRCAMDAGADLYGSSWHDLGVWGPFYLLRASLLQRMIEIAPTLDPLHEEEDMGITALARAAHGRVVIVPWSAKFFNGLDYRLRDFDFARFRSTNAVTCGNRMQIQSEDPHAVVARAMQGLVDYLHHGRPLDWDHVWQGQEQAVSIRNPAQGDVEEKHPAHFELGPSVAVVVIGHNTSRYLEACLVSIFDQNFHPEEVVYVDDASSDDSLAVASRFESHGLKVLGLPSNQGMCAARMAGVEHTTAQLLLFVDSDNELPPDYLAHMLEGIGDHQFVYPSKEFIGEGTVLAKWLSWHPGGTWEPPEPDRAQMWRANYCDTCSLVRRDAFLAVGGWRANPADTMFDWELFLRLSARGSHARSRAKLRYRVHGSNWSERERGQRNLLNGLVRRQAVTITVATIWSGRLPELAGPWMQAAASSLREAGKGGCELLILDDSAGGFPWEFIPRDLFHSIHVHRIRQAVGTNERRPNRRATAEFLSAACNDILRLASGDVIWFIEDDVMVPAHAADALLSELLQADDAPHPAVAGCYRSRHQPDEWIACEVSGGRVVHLAELPDQVTPIQMTGTGCLMVLRDLLDGIGFMAEWRYQHLRATGHDWSFAWQLHERATPVRLVPSVICRHHTTVHAWY